MLLAVRGSLLYPGAVSPRPPAAATLASRPQLAPGGSRLLAGPCAATRGKKASGSHHRRRRHDPAPEDVEEPLAADEAEDAPSLGQGSAQLPLGHERGLEPLPADEYSMSEVAEHSWTRGGRGVGGSGGRLEPPPADGEGTEFSMTDVAGRTGGADAGAGGSEPFAGLPPQDGHYHYDKQDDPAAAVPASVDESWESLEDPDALLRPAPARQAPEHMPMYRGEPDESEGYKEPGQDIASALPGRWGDSEDFTFGAYRNPDEQDGEA
ncbi:hypothetical protein ABPG75_008616 [Micractinium tetrahymenae]